MEHGTWEAGEEGVFFCVTSNLPRKKHSKLQAMTSPDDVEDEQQEQQAQQQDMRSKEQKEAQAQMQRLAMQVPGF